MKRISGFLILTGLALALALLLPVFAQDAPDYAKSGPFGVGTQAFMIPDKAGELSVSFNVWYPVATPDAAGTATTEVTGAVPRAIRNAAPALTEAPYPLLIISPGLGGSPIAYTLLAAHLASYGFVVAGAGHNDGPSPQITTLLLYDRPQDIVREIAYADTLTAPDGALAGLIDTEHIAVLGHSTGGTTAFQAGGASVDFSALEAWCMDKGSDQLVEETCQFVGHEDELAAGYGADPAPAGLLPPVWDERVDAIVAMAPGGELHAFGDDGMAAVQVSTLILVGTADEYVSPEYNAYWAYDHISSSQKALVAIEGGTHMMFGRCCGYDEALGGPRSEDLWAHLTTAFLLDILKGDLTAHNALLPDAVSFTGVEYQAQGF